MIPGAPPILSFISNEYPVEFQILFANFLLLLLGDQELSTVVPYRFLEVACEAVSSILSSRQLTLFSFGEFSPELI